MSDRNRYIIGFILAVTLIVVVIIMIVRGLVATPSGSGTPAQTDLTTYVASGNSVQLTIDSPIVSAEEHRDIIITVSNYQATITITKGYDNEQVNTQNYPVSTSQYAIFLRALKLNGFAMGNNDPSVKDERGHCALGDRYIYEGIDATGNDLQRYWYTSCGNGTFQGDVRVINRLFREQIPDYSKLTNGISL